MDDRRVGAILRALRRRAGLRQLDVAAKAACHQTTISRVERGFVGKLSIDLVRRMFAAVGARFDGDVRWQGGALDRLLDQRHAELVEGRAAHLQRFGWLALTEVTFSDYGDRGSIDLLGIDPVRRVVAVFEMKSEFGAIDETLRRHDVKARIARKIVKERFGWWPATVGRILVVADSQANRSVVRRHPALFAAAYPHSSRDVRAWLKAPTQAMSGIWFVSLKHPQVGMRNQASGGPSRVRHPRSKAA